MITRLVTFVVAFVVAFAVFINAELIIWEGNASVFPSEIDDVYCLTTFPSICEPSTKGAFVGRTTGHVFDLDNVMYLWDGGYTLINSGDNTFSQTGFFANFGTMNLPSSSFWLGFTSTGTVGSNCLDWQSDLGTSMGIYGVSNGVFSIGNCAFRKAQLCACNGLVAGNTHKPTRSPTAPSQSPTRNPTRNPTPYPSLNPTRNPSKNPTSNANQLVHTIGTWGVVWLLIYFSFK
jgi:hypothetical protein